MRYSKLNGTLISIPIKLGLYKPRSTFENWGFVMFYHRKIIVLSSVLFLSLATNLSHASTQFCKNAPIIVTKKNVGTVSYYASDCSQKWDNQDIQLDFMYTRDIPEWAFKRAATHFLKKNVSNFTDNSALNKIGFVAQIDER